MKKNLFTLVFTVLLLAGMGQTTLDTALNFNIKDTYGNTLNLFDILDEQKIVVIDFFSTA